MTKEWAARLPKSIRVGPFDLRVDVWDSAVPSKAPWGEFDSAEQRIAINSSVATLPFLVDSTLHELLHGAWFAAGLSDDDKEERIVSQLSTALVQIYRDNPALVEWLSEAAKAMRLSA